MTSKKQRIPIAISLLRWPFLTILKVIWIGAYIVVQKGIYVRDVFSWKLKRLLQNIGNIIKVCYLYFRY
jgi:hypothetical protein